MQRHDAALTLKYLKVHFLTFGLYIIFHKKYSIQFKYRDTFILYIYPYLNKFSSVPVDASKYCWISIKQCTPWWDTAFCGVPYDLSQHGLKCSNRKLRYMFSVRLAKVYVKIPRMCHNHEGQPSLGTNRRTERNKNIQEVQIAIFWRH